MVSLEEYQRQLMMQQYEQHRTMAMQNAVAANPFIGHQYLVGNSWPLQYATPPQPEPCLNPKLLLTKRG